MEGIVAGGPIQRDDNGFFLCSVLAAEAFDGAGISGKSAANSTAAELCVEPIRL